MFASLTSSSQTSHCFKLSLTVCHFELLTFSLFSSRCLLTGSQHNRPCRQLQKKPICLYLYHSAVISRAVVLNLILFRGGDRVTIGTVIYVTIHNSNKTVAVKIILWLEVSTTWGTVLKGHSIRKVENHCSGASWGHHSSLLSMMMNFSTVSVDEGKELCVPEHVAITDLVFPASSPKGLKTFLCIFLDCAWWLWRDF